MEKKLKNNLNKIVLTIMVLTISLWVSNLRTGSQGWWSPMVGGVISIFGLYLEKTKMLDIGTLLLVSSFFYLMWNIPFTYLNLIFILCMIFFFFGLWIFMKREVFVKKMESDLIGIEGRNYLEEYKKNSTLYYVKTLFMGLFVSTAGGFIAVHSFIGPFRSGLALFLNVFFSVVVLFGLYSLMFLLPKYFITE